MSPIKSLSITALSSLLLACGGGNSSGGAEGSRFSLGVSDNPADVNKVVIAFNQVVLKGVNGTSGTFSFDVASGGQPSQVDLLSVTGSDVAPLLSNQDVPTGNYQLCIYMLNDETGAANTSFVETTTSAVEGLTTNSNGSCGGTGATDPDTGRLFFNQAFTIAAGNNNFVAEFNLEQGLLSPRGSNTFWTLKPTAVQLVNTAEVGSINGTLSPTLVDDCHSDAGAAGLVAFTDKVYLYPGLASIHGDSTAVPSVQTMVDFRDAAAVAETELAPIAAARVTPVEAGGTITGYAYGFGFVVAGNYSIGLTCTAQNDDADAVNGDTGGADTFFISADASGISVDLNANAVRDLP